MWEKEKFGYSDLSLAIIKKILISSDVKRVRYLSLTGGEPFLREDIANIYALIRSLHPRCRVTISSNGVLTGKIIKFFSGANNPRNISLEISMHGITSHDHMTQSKGSLRQSEQTIGEIQKRFPKLKLSVKFVITPWNYNEIEKTFDYCQERGLPLIVKMIENVKSYTNSIRYEENTKQKIFSFTEDQLQDILCFLNRVNNNKGVNRYFIEYLVGSLQGKPINKQCLVSRKSLFFNANGDIYNCRNFEPIGNIKEGDVTLHITGYKNRICRQQRDSSICQKCVALPRFLI
ncbi:MAG: radical SAM protein [Candidatus Omnitrophica bacterium]|nr:radical SAM protein [Candidatus Omnitrophota bacterium]